MTLGLMRGLAMAVLLLGITACTEDYRPPWEYVGTGTDDYHQREEACAEHAIYQASLTHWDAEMDEEDHQEENAGRPRSFAYQKRFADCMQRHHWRRLS